MRKKYIKDIVIYGIIIVILFVVIKPTFFKVIDGNNLDFAETSQLIFADIILVLTGIIGLFEFADEKGLIFIVPDSYIAYKERRRIKQTQEIVESYLDQNAEFIKTYNNEQVRYFLNTIGLTKDGFRSVKLQLIKAKMRNQENITTAKAKLSEILYNSDIIIDLREATDCSPPDDKVRYFIKFHDLMHDASLCKVIADIMALYIRCSLDRAGLENINVCMVPHSSNYLLGYNVSRILNKNFIKMFPNDKIIANFTYEGVVDDRESMKVIVIHDTLFTSNQVCQSIDTLKSTHHDCEVVGIFCLIYRNIHNGKQTLERKGYKVYALLELSEDEISKNLCT